VGELPGIDISAIQTVSSLPRIVGTTFGASVKSVFTSQLEGGVGDVLALENENAQLDHIKEINTQLLSLSGVRQTAGTDEQFTSAAAAKHFHVGDTVRIYDDSATAWDTTDRIVKSVDTSTGIVVFTVADNLTIENGKDLIVIHARAGFTSLDDVVAQDGIPIGGVVNTVAGGGVRAYDLEVGGRALGEWNAAANVRHKSGVATPIALTEIDKCIERIRENGGEPKLLLMGHDQYFKMEQLLFEKQRYMGQEEYQVGVGSERTFPGTKTGLVLATYMGIPILPDADVPKSVDASGNVTGSNIYVLDTDYMELAVAQPTQYVENRDYFAANALVVRGLLYTMGEMRCRNMWVQAKITDTGVTA